MKTKKEPTLYGGVMTLLAYIAFAAPGWGMVGLCLLAIAGMFAVTALWLARSLLS